MKSNMDRYKTDLAALIKKGADLSNALQLAVSPTEFRAAVLKEYKGDGEKTEAYLKKLPDFGIEYQNWYTEAQALIKQLIPDRLEDFKSFYEKPKNRKVLSHGNYVIADYLQGTVRRDYSGAEIVSQTSAFPQMRQQFAIVSAIEKRFESSLFDIQRLVRADLFDSELDAARELLRQKFVRAAGAMAGVVLERHLQQVCDNHNIKIAKRDPAISDLNDALKGANAIQMEQWRFIQRLGDLRNLCDHNRKQEPSSEQVTDLIDGTDKILKSVF